MALAPWGKPQYFDNNGDPLDGGLLYTYLGGTTTPATTYTDSALLYPNTNPVVLDSAGRCDLWLSTGTYKYVLKTAAGVTLWTIDNVSATSLSADTITENNLSAGAAGSAPIEGGVLSAQAAQPGGLAWLTGVMRALKNGAAALGPRKYLNLKEGSNITLTHADNPGSDAIDVTIAASGAASPLTDDSVQESYLAAGTAGSGPTEGGLLSAAAAQPGGLQWISGAIRTLKAGASALGPRKSLNLIEGSNVTLTLADNSGSDAIDVTVTATGTFTPADDSIVESKLAIGAAGSAPVEGGVLSATVAQPGGLKWLSGLICTLKNGLSGLGPRRNLNLKEGSGITITTADNAGLDAVDATITLTPFTSITITSGVGVDTQLTITSASGRSQGIQLYESATLRGQITSGSTVVSIMNSSSHGIHVTQGARPNIYLGGPDSTGMATNSTTGFVYIPQMAGAPTGAPGSWPGYVPIVWNSYNNTLHVYSGGVWKQV